MTDGEGEGEGEREKTSKHGRQARHGTARQTHRHTSTQTRTHTHKRAHAQAYATKYTPRNMQHTTHRIAQHVPKMSKIKPKGTKRKRTLSGKSASTKMDVASPTSSE